MVLADTDTATPDEWRHGVRPFAAQAVPERDYSARNELAG
jgi:hypothetical protein